MTENELYDLLDSWENIEHVIQIISKSEQDLAVLMQLALHHPKQRSWRAAYLVDKIHDDFPELILPYLPQIIKKLPEEKNASKRRHWLKLVSMNALSEQDCGLLFDYCYKAFTSAKEAIAVRVHAMQILYNISEYEHDLKPELQQIIEHEMLYHPSAGIRSRGKKILQKLQKQIDSFK